MIFLLLFFCSVPMKRNKTKITQTVICKTNSPLFLACGSKNFLKYVYVSQQQIKFNNYKLSAMQSLIVKLKSNCR